ncbi:MAG: hypothetical protein KC443_18530 [Anaerolineales bacterium]|nr:hypothetical protein [Anaerolineales bacterium]
MHTILFRSDIDQTAAWKQALSAGLPTDMQLYVADSVSSGPSTNGRFHAHTSPTLLLVLTDLADWDKIAEQHPENSSLPVIYAGPRGASFQIGPGVITGQTACPVCLQQQSTLFPGLVQVAEETAVSLPPQTITRLAARLAAEVVAFIQRDTNSLLRRGYLLRQHDNSWQIYRGLRDPYCDSCSLYAHYPSEAIYIK